MSPETMSICTLFAVYVFMETIAQIYYALISHAVWACKGAQNQPSMTICEVYSIYGIACSSYMHS